MQASTRTGGGDRVAAPTVSMMSARSRILALPRATLAATVILVACATLAFGFVLQRGGLLLPEASPSPSVLTAVAPASPSPVAPGASTPGAATAPKASPAPTAPAAGSTRAPAASASPGSALATPASTAGPTAVPAPSPTPSPTAARTPSPTPPPSRTAVPGSAAVGTASAGRLALLVRCPGQPDCYVYTVRSGDNLWSVTHWFGVPMDRVLSLNPWIGPQAIVRPGEKLVIPTPTR